MEKKPASKSVVNQFQGTNLFLRTRSLGVRRKRGRHVLVQGVCAGSDLKPVMAVHKARVVVDRVPERSGLEDHRVGEVCWLL